MFTLRQPKKKLKKIVKPMEVISFLSGNLVNLDEMENHGLIQILVG